MQHLIANTDLNEKLEWGSAQIHIVIKIKEQRSVWASSEFKQPEKGYKDHT